jgi:hypothetical protein
VDEDPTVIVGIRFHSSVKLPQVGLAEQGQYTCLELARSLARYDLDQIGAFANRAEHDLPDLAVDVALIPEDRVQVKRELHWLPRAHQAHRLSGAAGYHVDDGGMPAAHPVTMAYAATERATVGIPRQAGPERYPIGEVAEARSV